MLNRPKHASPSACLIHMLLQNHIFHYTDKELQARLLEEFPKAVSYAVDLRMVRRVRARLNRGQYKRVGRPYPPIPEWRRLRFVGRVPIPVKYPGRPPSKPRHLKPPPRVHPQPDVETWTHVDE